MIKLGLFSMLVAFLPISYSAYGAAIDIHDFSQLAQGDVKEARYRQFIDELRCPKCQNQNLADSNSPIAADLRKEVYQLLQQGKADSEIVNFMVDRYGEFVLYRPRVSQLTYVLWFGPIVLILGGMLIVVVIVRRKPVAKKDLVLTTTQQKKLSRFLDNQ